MSEHEEIREISESKAAIDPRVSRAGACARHLADRHPLEVRPDRRPFVMGPERASQVDPCFDLLERGFLVFHTLGITLNTLPAKTGKRKSSRPGRSRIL